MNDYRIVEDKSRHDLAKKVTQLMDNGWRLAGGVSVTMVPSGILGPDKEYSQALFKRNEDSPAMKALKKGVGA